MNPFKAEENNIFFGVEIQTPITEEAIKRVAQQNIIFIQQYWEKQNQEKENPSKILYIEESEIERCRFLRFIKDCSVSEEVNRHFSHIYWISLHHYAVNGVENNIQKTSPSINEDLAKPPFYQNIWLVRMLEVIVIVGAITTMSFFTK